MMNQVCKFIAEIFLMKWILNGFILVANSNFGTLLYFVFLLLQNGQKLNLLI